jgi:hypothetical protein
MVVFLNEKVKVGVVFKNGGVSPKWFFYRGRKISIKEVTYSWKKKEGETIFLHFSVTDGVNLYDLSFEPEGLSWNLESVEDA